MPLEIYNPPSLKMSPGLYSVMTRVRPGSELIFLCGMADEGDSRGSPLRDEFDRQCDAVYKNIGAALASVGAGFANIVQFTTLLVDKADIARFREYRKREFPRLFPDKAYPPSTLLVVSGLADEHYRIEVQTIAAL
jgi:enamine deaminase RidA (YjgF/YER057c/UK114 family)